MRSRYNGVRKGRICEEELGESRNRRKWKREIVGRAKQPIGIERFLTGKGIEN